MSTVYKPRVHLIHGNLLINQNFTTDVFSNYANIVAASNAENKLPQLPARASCAQQGCDREYT